MMQPRDVMKAWKEIFTALKRSLLTKKKKLGEIRNMSEKNPGSRKVCRAILDRHDVMKTQVVNQVIEALQNETDKEKKKQIKQKVEYVFQQHSNGLIDQMLEMFSNK